MFDQEPEHLYSPPDKEEYAAYEIREMKKKRAADADYANKKIRKWAKKYQRTGATYAYLRWSHWIKAFAKTQRGFKR